MAVLVQVADQTFVQGNAALLKNYQTQSGCPGGGPMLGLCRMAHGLHMTMTPDK